LIADPLAGAGKEPAQAGVFVARRRRHCTATTGEPIICQQIGFNR
jgi:hypothetical protein